MDHIIPNLTILERSQISPPPATFSHRTLPLTFFDLSWLLFPPVHHLFFYHFPHPKSHFIETIIPNLKHSLSITLQHYFPFAGNLIVFPNVNDSTVARKPEIRYVEGDSVTVTFAEECCLDFYDLAGNHPRKCENFYPLVPPLGNAVRESDYVTLPLFSVQVTLFPNSGIVIGTTNHHSLGDASTRFAFVKAWALASISGTNELILTNGRSPPIYDRLLDIPNLVENKLKQTKLESFYQPPSLKGSGSADRVRATFILTRTHISHLKKQVITQVPTLEYVSSFTVTCGYIWSCIAKSLVKVGEKNGEDEFEQFILSVDCRSRMDPPVPQTYFGNCVAPCIVTINNVTLSGQNGFFIAAKLIGEGISKMVNNKEGMLKDAERWLDGFKVPARKIGVSGTPKLDFYGVNFGWGKPIKYETISIDYNGSISMSACKESAQDLEIGVCFPSMQMKAFADIFNHELETAIAW